jgi:hypothetical protein
MIDATVSRVRRELACLGRFRLGQGRCAAAPGPCASRRQRLTDASGIGEPLPPRPRAAGSRPGAGDPVASIISA